MDTPPTDETSTPVDTPARGRMPRMPSFKDPTAASAVMSHDYIFQRVSPLRNFARRVTANPAFETVVVLAIVANVIAMAMEDLPARHANVYSTANNAVNVVDKVTLAIYTAEFLLRVLAFGLMPLPRWCPAFLRPDQRIQISQDPSSKVVPIKNDYLGNMEAAMHAELRVGTDDLEAAQGQYYFKSNWNRLDFVVLCISYSAILVPGLNSLRSLRALRPLRMVQFVGPLHIILKSIWRAVGTLVDVVICLAFMFLFFALFGQQLFQGALLRRCVVPQGADAVRFNMSSPMFHDVMASVAQSPDAAPKNFTLYRPETFCSFASDAKGLACANVGRPTAVVSVLTHQGLEAVTVPTVCANYINPNFGFVSFDDLLHSLWTVFMMSSLNVSVALLFPSLAAVALESRCDLFHRAGLTLCML